MRAVLGGSARFVPLRNRDFRLLLIGDATSSLGGAMVPIALSFAILAEGGSAFDIGLVFGTVAVAELLLFLVAGVIVDRYPRRLVMALADLVRGVSQLVLGLLFITGHAPILAVCACAVAQGLAGSFYSPAETAFLPTVVDAEQLQAANGLTQIASSAASVLGPAVAGVLVATIGGGWAIAINGVSYLVNTIMLLQIRASEHSHDGDDKTSILSQIRDGWAVFISMDWYLTIATSWSVFQVFFGMYIAVGPVVAKQYLGGVGAWSAILTVGGIGSVIGGLALLHLEPKRPLATAMLVLVPFALMPLAVALTLPVIALCALSVIASVGALITLTLFDTVVQRLVPREILGRVFAIDLSLSQIGFPVGLFLGGALVPVIGSRTVLAVAGIGGTVGCLVISTLGPIRRMRLPAPEPVVATPVK